MKELARKVIHGLVESGAISIDNIAISITDLSKAFIEAEKYHAEQQAPGNAHIVAVFSGRTALQKQVYLETTNPDKNIFCPHAFDPEDTIRRVEYGIHYAINCMKNTFLNTGVFQPTFVYFNGGDDQNAELQAILEKQGSFLGLPASLFIIRSIPIINTMGQILDLSEFFEHVWPKYCLKYNIKLDLPVNLACISNTYHTTRIKHAIVNSSPLLTGSFWEKYWETNPEIRERVAQRFPGMIEYSLCPGQRLKNANIMVAGCDRKIVDRPFGLKDAYCDMEATVRYASEPNFLPLAKAPNPPSLASSINGGNFVTSFRNGRSDTLILQSTLRQSMRYLFHKPSLYITKKSVQNNEQLLLTDGKVNGLM